MLYGVITVPVTDLRALPDSKSECLSQALFGTPVQIREIQKKFAQIALVDGYTGWCRLAHMDQVTFARWRKYVAAPRTKVKVSVAKIMNLKRQAIYPYYIFFGTELIISKTGGKTYFDLPLGLKAPINSSSLQIPSKKEQRVNGRRLVTTAKRFIGTPYLWGGLTPFGFDCSGLVQAVCRFHGLTMPRDTRDQRSVGYTVGRDSLLPGDLLFFPGHVAMSCGGKEFIHASAGRGIVMIDSFDPKADNYRQDLDKSFEFARRLPL